MKNMKTKIDPKFVSLFQKKSYGKLKYRIYVPKKYPKYFLIHLHGSGGRGNDNTSQLHYMDSPAFKRLIDDDQTVIIVPQMPSEHRFVLVDWKATIYDPSNLTETFEITKTIDIIKRIKERYPGIITVITGHSMGGYGTFYCVNNYLSLFDGAIPICGGTPKVFKQSISVPMKIIHGKNDTVVPVDGSRYAYELIKKDNKNVSYIEVEDYGHNVWNYVYEQDNYFLDFFKQILESKNK